MKSRIKKLTSLLIIISLVLGMAELLNPAEAEAASKKIVIEKLSKSLVAVSCKVKLKKKSGSGSHAKILLDNGGSAVSFGIQYDVASAKYPSKPAFLIENITNPKVGSGGQSYKWTGKARFNKYYTLMMTLNRKTGIVNVYVNGKKVGSVRNKPLKNGFTFAKMEAAGRLNGDKVDAYFTRFKVKGNGEKYKDKTLRANIVINQNAGMKSYWYRDFKSKMKKMNLFRDISKGNIFRIKGKIKGVNGDWDSAYTQCSSVIVTPI